MKEIEQDITVLIQNHFPDFYKESGNNFIEFVKEYYNWAQQSNNFLNHSRNLIEYRDIDNTIDEFLYHFKEKYLQGAPVNFGRSKFDIKHIVDLYRSKGTERGTKLFFARVYGDSSTEVYFPGQDVLRPSDGQWYVPTYLEVEIASKTSSFLGKLITGSASGATAFVEGVNRKVIDGKYIDVLYLSNISGTFQFNEIITQDGVLQGCPKVVGSLTRLTVADSGRGFNVGDIVTITSDRRGKQGKARVDAINSTTGKVTFTLLDGGTGYRLETVPEVAERMLLIKNITSSNAFISTFSSDETIYQPLVNVTFTTSNTLFGIGSLVTGANSSANVATGRVMGRTQFPITGTATANSTSNVVIGTGTNFAAVLDSGDYIRFDSNNSIFRIRTVDGVANDTHLYLTTNGPNVISNTVVMANGSILMTPVSGNFADADRVYDSTALISLYSNVTATGVVMGVNANALGLLSITNTFTANEYNYIYGSSSNVHANVTLVGTGSSATFEIGSLTDEETVYLNTDIIGSNNYLTLTGLTGSVSSNVTSPQVNGVGTSFTTEIYRGDYVKFSSNNTIFQVNSVSNDTILILTTNAPASTSNSLSRSNGAYTGLFLDSFRYGFPKLASANLTSILSTALETDTYDIGTIASLTGINPGSNYNITPFVRVRDRGISGFNRRDLNLVIENQTGTFLDGEEITQNFSAPSYTLGISGSNNSFTVNESVTQDIGASNSYGLVLSSSLTSSKLSTSSTFVASTLQPAISGTVSANGTSSQVNGTVTTFGSDLSAGDFIKFSGNNLLFQVNNIVNNTILMLTTNATSITSNTLQRATEVAKGLSSGKYFFVNTATSDTVLSLSRGSVINSISGELNVRRKTFNQSFTPSVQVTGTTSGATADVISVSQIPNSSLMGNNAIVNSSAGIVNGSIVSASVVDSGFAYEDGEIVTLSANGNQYIATAYANLINQGVGEGYFLSTRGFLNSDKYIHDGDYYQAFSYEVQTSLPLEIYADTLKKLMHVAGTKLFGKVIKVNSANLQPTTSGAIITQSS